MAAHHDEPRTATAISGESTPPTSPLPWDEAVRRLAESQVYWLATTTSEGRPHVRPVLGVWIRGRWHTSSSPGARKAQNLATDDRCSVSLSVDDVDIVLDGTATKVTDPSHLQEAADAYRSKYGWPAVVEDGAFDAPYGAPTAGPPPYEVYQVTPAVVYGFGTDEEHAPRSTRWVF